MSLGIDPWKVRAVLLADGWHVVEKGSFNLDTYGFVDGDYVVGKGTGFEFLEERTSSNRLTLVAGPLSSVLAVKHETSE